MKLRIGQPEYGGTFQASPDAMPSFGCRLVLPGELVEIASQVPERILEAAADRIAPRCPHFGACGGCDYQHANEATQGQLKLTVLHRTLDGAGLAEIPEIALHVAEHWEYRNRVRLRVEKVHGTYRVGYNRRGGREFLPITECPISSPILLRAAFGLLAVVTMEPMVAGWLASIAEVEFQSNQSVVQMTLFTRNERTEGFVAFCEGVRRHVPELIGGGCLAVNAGYGAKERARWGADGLAHRVAERNYWVSRGGFFQVNRFLVGRMVELVTRGRAGALAWDLYAGVGLFSRVLADSFGEVVAVESSAVAANDLVGLANANKTRSLRALKMETVEFLRAAVVQRERPDLIVMDPPRAGLGADVCRLLGRVGAARMVYVSCDPTTLARDLAMLVHSGYCLAEVHLLDLFPQTFHLETVVFLTK